MPRHCLVLQESHRMGRNCVEGVSSRHLAALAYRASAASCHLGEMGTQEAGETRNLLWSGQDAFFFPLSLCLLSRFKSVSLTELFKTDLHGRQGAEGTWGGGVHGSKSGTILAPGAESFVMHGPCWAHIERAPPACQSLSGLQLLTSGASGTGDVTIPVPVSQWVEVSWGHRGRGNGCPHLPSHSPWHSLGHVCLCTLTLPPVTSTGPSLFLNPGDDRAHRDHCMPGFPKRTRRLAQ